MARAGNSEWRTVSVEAPVDDGMQIENRCEILPDAQQLRRQCADRRARGAPFAETCTVLSSVDDLRRYADVLPERILTSSNRSLRFGWRGGKYLSCLKML
jgi:hypothetical protein